MDIVIIFVIQILYSIAVLALISFGLALVFGMMRVINLAHGEFLTLGAYAAIFSVKAGINLWVAALLVAPLAVGAWSFIVERLLIRFLYGRLVYTMLATWGLSLAMAGAMTMIFGTTTEGISADMGAVAVGSYQASNYSLIVIMIAIVVALIVAWILFGSASGRVARAAMENQEMTQAFGYPIKRIYMMTFIAGGMLAGLAGGILAPTTGISPYSGGTWIADAFITVITGGTAPVLGTLASAGVLGLVSSTVSFLFSSALGGVALLVAALILLRILPTGIASLWQRGSK